MTRADDRQGAIRGQAVHLLGENKEQGGRTVGTGPRLNGFSFRRVPIAVFLGKTTWGYA